MSKALQATCEGGVVKVGSVSVDGAIVFSEGSGPSQGVLILDGAEKFYLSKSSPDLKTTLEKTIDALQAVAEALNQVVTVNTAIGAGMTGPSTAPPPTLAVDLAVITTKATAVTTAKTALNTLKGNLR